MTTMLPGDFYLTRIGPPLRPVIEFMEWAIGDSSYYQHAGIFLGDINNDGIDMVAEAMPGGLQVIPLSQKHGKELIHSSFDLTDEQRSGIVTRAWLAEGTPYSYLGYLYLGLTSFHICPTWVKDKVSSPNAFFCSQFVDYVYSMSGVHLFDDDRLYLDVTPGDLARLVTNH